FRSFFHEYGLPTYCLTPYADFHGRDGLITYRSFDVDAYRLAAETQEFRNHWLGYLNGRGELVGIIAGNLVFGRKIQYIDFADGDSSLAIRCGQLDDMLGWVDVFWY